MNHSRAGSLAPRTTHGKTTLCLALPAGASTTTTYRIAAARAGLLRHLPACYHHLPLPHTTTHFRAARWRAAYTQERHCACLLLAPIAYLPWHCGRGVAGACLLGCERDRPCISLILLCRRCTCGSHAWAVVIPTWCGPGLGQFLCCHKQAYLRTPTPPHAHCPAYLPAQATATGRDRANSAHTRRCARRALRFLFLVAVRKVAVAFLSRWFP